MQAGQAHVSRQALATSKPAFQIYRISQSVLNNLKKPFAHAESYSPIHTSKCLITHHLSSSAAHRYTPVLLAVIIKMRINGALLSTLYSSAALLGHVQAEDDAADASSTSVVESSTSSAIEKPTFTVRS